MQNRNFVCNKKLPSIPQLSNQAFYDVVIVRMRDQLRNLLLGAFDTARQGRELDAALVRDTLVMLMDVGIDVVPGGYGPSLRVYEAEFEAPFLEGTTHFHGHESSNVLTGSTGPEYIAHVTRRFADERGWATTTMSHTTLPKVIDVLGRALVADHIVHLLDMEGSGLQYMLATDRVADIRAIHTFTLPLDYHIAWESPTRLPSMLLRSTPAAVLRNSIRVHVQRVVQGIVDDCERRKAPVALIQALVDARAKYMAIVMAALDMQQPVTDAFTAVFNGDASTLCAELLAAYVDEHMRVAFRAQTEAGIESTLTDVLHLFRYLVDKDVFEAHYKLHLQKRLLAGSSANDDAEKTMIAKLKVECGYAFTSKLEGMFNDMQRSRDFMEGYQSALGLEVSVLTSSYWPAAKVAACRLPPHIMAATDDFKTHYLRKFPQRVLTWDTTKGSATLRADIGGRKYEVVVSTYQMCCLLMFNDRDSVSYQELESGVQAPADELKRHLLSLTTPKAPFLLRSTKSKTVGDDEIFTFNPRFASDVFKIKVPLVSQKVTAVEAAGIQTAVDDGRRFLIDATLVRIMKARKVLEHNLLIAEAIKQLSARFRPQPADIKRQIESLIEREYLERGADDARDTYTYLT